MPRLLGVRYADLLARAARLTSPGSARADR
jgi:hypothetical protein